MMDAARLMAAGPLSHCDFTALAAALGRCPHLAAVPVELLITGERVAWLCPDCGSQLPA